jgi:predicted negative regulator of RcsB-dependent stress response
LARRVALITNAPLAESADGLFSPLSSVRRQILLPARALEARGVAVQILSLPSWPVEQLRAVIEKADRIVFGSMLDDHDEAAYRDAVSLCGPAQRLAFYVDEADAGRSFYREVAPASHVWLAPSESSAKALEHAHQCRVAVAPLPAECERSIPRVPQRGLRTRIATLLAKRAGVGLDPWRLSLLWSGNATTSERLRDELPGLRTLASRVPLYLHCLTEGEAVFAAEGGPSSALRIGVERKTPQAMAEALAACDAVVLPDEATRVDALTAGRLAIAPGELPEILRHPTAALERLQREQRDVARNHSPAAIARFWMRVLGFASGEDAAPLLAQARSEYDAGRLDEAEQVLGSLLQRDSALPEAQHLLGNIYQDQGKADRAITAYRRALRLDAQFAAAHNDLGTAYAAKGWHAEAMECYAQAVRLDSSNESAQANLAQTLLRAGRRRDALPHLKAALRLRVGQFFRRTLKISSRRSMP